MKGDETKRPPGYLKHKGSGQAYVLIDGRAAYLGVYGSPESRRRYSRAIAEWTAGTWTGRASGDPTVADLLAGWWRWAERHYLKRGRPTSEIGVAKGVVQILLDLYDDLPARDFGPACLRTVRAEMVRRGWCRTNVNRQVLRVRAIWRWGVAEEIVPGSVLPGLDAVRG
ncbi:MAG TPA: recombinase XerD, partial [Phycisphaerae bacterium]|nr:recombinase XerD [Phycisphaerae bacterium]